MIIDIPDSHFDSSNPIITTYILLLYYSVEHLIGIEIEVALHCLASEILERIDWVNNNSVSDCSGVFSPVWSHELVVPLILGVIRKICLDLYHC